MKILYLVQSDPEQCRSGTEQRTHRLLLKLREMGDVQVVHWGEFEDRSVFAAMFRRMFRPAEWPWRMGRRCRPWGDAKFDLVVARYLNTAVRARAWEAGPCKVDVDDLPSEAARTVWSRRWPLGLRWIPNWVVGVWERWALRKLSAAWVANKADVDHVSRWCPCEVFENEALPPKPGYSATGRQRRMLLTVGNLGYPPNAEGVIWFVRKVWPRVRAKFPDIEYVVSGYDEAKVETIRSEKGVVLSGFVEDLDGLYEEALAVVAPVWSGAGTSIKVMEALSRKRVVFATPFAARGCSSDEGSGQLVVCESAKSMSQSICNWLSQQPSTLNPKPGTRNLKLGTQNPKPETRNPK